MDREVVTQKLESLRRCIQRIADKCPATPEALALDPDLQDILALNLTRAVQLCVDIGAHIIAGLGVPPPDTMGQTFDVLTRAGVIPENLALQLKKIRWLPQYRGAQLRSNRLGDCSWTRPPSPAGFHRVRQGRCFGVGMTDIQNLIFSLPPSPPI